MIWPPKRRLRLLEVIRLVTTNINQYLLQTFGFRQLLGKVLEGCCLLGWHTLILLLFVGYAIVPGLVLSFILPTWLAILLGVPLGALSVGFVYTYLVFSRKSVERDGMGAEGSFAEISLLLPLILILILIPVFQRAEQNRAKSRVKAQATATAKAKAPTISPSRQKP